MLQQIYTLMPRRVQIFQI